MRPVTSPCFDFKDKRAFNGSSLKDRIRINDELKKSVKLNPRKSHTNRHGPPTLKNSPQFFSNGNILAGQTIQHVGTSNYAGPQHAASQHNMPIGLRSGSLGAAGFAPGSEQSSKMSINLFNSQAMGNRNAINSKFKTINVAARRSQEIYRGPYTSNRAFNSTYQTNQLQKTLKNV